MNPELRHIAGRLLSSMITLLGTCVLTFVLTHAIPGDPARAMAGSKASPEVLKAIRERHRMDDPGWMQLGRYLLGVMRGDLGYSYITEQPVAEAILARVPTTAAFAGLSVVFWMWIAIPVGALTARAAGGALDRSVLVLATIGLSLPSFWCARVMQYGLGYKLGWFPIGGYWGFEHLVLPAITLAVLAVGFYARLVHANMVEVLGSGYVRAARARGVSEWSILFKHGLRNALIPIVTILAMDIASLLGGVMFIENVFMLPGIGTLAVQSVFNLDVPMIMGTVLFSAFAVVLANLVVDILYRRIDPRVRDAV